MCQVAVERTLGKLVTDEAFRKWFYQDPAAASFHAGLELSKTELDALSRLSVTAIAELSTRLDDRICRLHLAEEGLPTSVKKRNMETDQPLADSSIGPGGTPATGMEGGGKPQRYSGDHT
jgi:hypothetical protein